jgi:CheY-like chemotaxis protein
LGTTFKVYFPSVREEIRPSSESASRPVVRGRETILLVEDEASVREPAAEYLADHGYTVLKASRGAEAVEITQQHAGPIDLLLTDIVMPQMSGRELAEKIAALHPEAKIVFMSGYSNNVLSNVQGPIRNHTVLQKPFRLSVLGERIREILNTGVKGATAGE